MTENHTNDSGPDHESASDLKITRMTLGRYLKEQRQKKSIELKTVSQMTKINLTILEALENDRYDQLPTRPYVVGFIKNYSKYFGLNETKCLELLDQNHQEDHQHTNDPILNQHKTSEFLNGKLVLPLILVVIFITILLYKLFDSHKISPQKNSATTQDQKQTITESTHRLELVEDLNNQELSPVQDYQAGTPDGDQSHLLNNTQKIDPLPIEQNEDKVKKGNNEDPTAQKESSKQNEEPKDKIRFYPMPSKLYSFSSGSPSQEAKQKLEASQSRFLEGKQNILIVATNDSSWLTHKVDNNKIVKYVLEKGTSVLLQGDLIRTFLGNVHATEIFLNGKFLSIQSRSGVKSLIFPQEKGSQYFLPIFIFQKDGSTITSEEYLANNPQTD